MFKESSKSKGVFRIEQASVMELFVNILNGFIFAMKAPS